jgi:hypothetical protein
MAADEGLGYTDQANWQKAGSYSANQPTFQFVNARM